MTEQQAQRIIDLLESIESQLTLIAGSVDAVEENTSGRPRR